MKKFGSILLKSLSFIGVFLLVIVITLYTTLLLICYGPSQKARNLFVTTFLETGALKFVVGLVLPSSKVDEIVKSNSLQTMEQNVDTNLIKVNDNKEKEIEIKKISGSNFFATLMIVPDPSKVSVATTHPFTKYGKTLDEIVKETDSIAGINGGIYESSGNTGGYPMGLVVSKGEILWNTNGVGYHLIGFDENNILRIIDISGKSKGEVEKLVQDEKIRDAVTFQEEASDANNHFVKLIVNGEKRLVNGLGSGANPRTAIGQREDGTVLLLVTDGRGASGHLGATAGDLIDIMEEYGAVNAANIDGGSSSTMYYKDSYLMTSVTLYYANSSWRLPEAFVVSK